MCLKLFMYVFIHYCMAFSDMFTVKFAYKETRLQGPSGNKELISIPQSSPRN